MDELLKGLLLEMEDERLSARRRETFLLSAILHLLLVLLVVTQPDLFRKVLQKDSALERNRPQDTTLLYQPPTLPKLKAPPKTAVLSDANRRAQPALIAPPPERFQPPPASQTPAPAPPAPRSGDENRLARQLPPIGIPEAPEPRKEPPKQRPALEPVPNPGSEHAQLTIPQLTPPGRGTDAILRGMRSEERRVGKECRL